MKQLYLKQKVFALTERYKIYDENQNIVYHVQGHFFSIKNKMDMYKDDQIIYHIERKLFRFLPEYILLSPDHEVIATVKRNFSIIKGKLTIDSKYGQLVVNGQIMQHDFHVIKDEKEIVTVQKKWLSWGDSYQISILDEGKEEFYAALVLLIDVIFHQSSHHSNSSHH